MDMSIGKPEHRHRLRRFSHMIRGGAVVGLLALAAGSVLLGLAGVHYSAGLQTVIGGLGVVSGAIFGAREPA
jgi:hypothetical protein